MDIKTTSVIPAVMGHPVGWRKEEEEVVVVVVVVVNDVGLG